MNDYSPRSIEISIKYDGVDWKYVGEDESTWPELVKKFIHGLCGIGYVIDLVEACDGVENLHNTRPVVTVKVADDPWKDNVIVTDGKYDELDDEDDECMSDESFAYKTCKGGCSCGE